MRWVISTIVSGILGCTCAASSYRVSLAPLPEGATKTGIYSLSNSGKAVGMSSEGSWSTNRPTWWDSTGTYHLDGGPSSRYAVGSPFDDIAMFSYGTGFSPTAVDVRLANGTLSSVELPAGDEFVAAGFGGEGSFYFVNEQNLMYRWTATEGSVLAANFSELTTPIGHRVGDRGNRGLIFKQLRWSGFCGDSQRAKNYDCRVRHHRCRAGQ